MCETAQKNILIGMFTWMFLVAGAIAANNAFFQYSRPLAFFGVVAFWYWLTLVFREGNKSTYNGREYTGLSYFGKTWHREDVITFEVMIMPITFASAVAIIYAALGDIYMGLSVLITIILWMAFFLVDSARGQGELFSQFDFSQLNMFSVFGIILDVVGIFLSLIAMF